MPIAMSALLTGLALRVPPTAANYTAPGGWEIVKNTTACHTSRQFMRDGRVLELRVGGLIFRGSGSVSYRDPTGPRTGYVQERTSGLIAIDGGAVQIQGSYNETASPFEEGRIISASFERGDMPKLSAAQRVVVTRKGESGPVFEAPALSAALAAQLQCNRDLYVRWGIDPKEVDKIATLAKPINGAAQWIVASDYPAEARRQNLRGASGVLWAISTTGAVTDCRVIQPSGSQALDTAACNALTARGKYEPALDKAGGSVVSWATRVVVWTPPQQ